MPIFDYEIEGVLGGRDEAVRIMRAKAAKGYRFVGAVQNLGLVFEKVDVSIPPPPESSPSPPNPGLVASGRGSPRKK